MASLYRHFDAAGQLLYVGSSLNAVARLAQHRGKSPWFSEIAQVTIEWHASRAHAAYAEAIAIRDENPLHNVARPIPRDPDAPAELEPEVDEDNEVADCRENLLPFVTLAGGVGQRTIVYTILPAMHGAVDVLKRMARIIDGPGFAAADVVNPGGTFERVMRAAQHEGTRIVTDTPRTFDVVRDVLCERGVSLLTVEPLVEAVRRAQNTANVTAYRKRKTSS